jgi:hypothetical protein
VNLRRGVQRDSEQARQNVSRFNNGSDPLLRTLQPRTPDTHGNAFSPVRSVRTSRIAPPAFWRGRLECAGRSQRLCMFPRRSKHTKAVAAATALQAFSRPVIHRSPVRRMFRPDDEERGPDPIRVDLAATSAGASRDLPYRTRRRARPGIRARRPAGSS